jgi:hypothetical protein
VLLDRLLATAGIPPDDVPGPELGSHLEIALAVAAGITDAGLGVRAAATDLDLDFVSLTWERYDIVLGAEALPTAASLITALREPLVREAITALGGYDPGRRRRSSHPILSTPPTAHHRSGLIRITTRQITVLTLSCMPEETIPAADENAEITGENNDAGQNTQAAALARWMSPGVGGIGLASFLADVGHEVPTALLPSFVTSTLGAPAAALRADRGHLRWPGRRGPVRRRRPGR